MKKKLILFAVLIGILYLWEIIFFDVKPLRIKESPQNPMVSVVLPTYNRATLLSRAMESILNQTFKDFELIIIDDGSSDQTIDIVRSYQRFDSRIRLLRNKYNCGISCARNKGNAAARGKYIVIMDSDDMAMPELLQEEVSFMEAHPEITMAYPQKIPLRKAGKQEAIQIYPVMWLLVTNAPWNVGNIFRRNFIQKHHIRYNEQMIATEDYDFWAQMLIAGGRFAAIPQKLVAFRNHHTNNSQYYIEMQKNTWKTAHKLLDFFKVPQDIRADKCLTAKFVASLKQNSFSKEDIETYLPFICQSSQEEKPIFSIIISTYNYANYLPKAIESVIKSHMASLELIIVDDGSMDKTADILKTYAQKDQRIKIITQKNKGLSAARNRALKEAKGRYVWFVDADDWIEADALNELYLKASSNDLDIVSFYTRNMDLKNKPIPSDKWNVLPEAVMNIKKPWFTVDDLGVNAILSYPEVSGKNIYRRQFLIDHQILFPENVYFEDNVFFTEALFQRAKIGIIPKVFYNKRLHERQITAHREKYFDSSAQLPMLIYKRIIKAYPQSTKIRPLFDSYFQLALSRYKNLSEADKAYFKKDLIRLLRWLEQQGKEVFWERKKEILKAVLAEETEKNKKEKMLLKKASVVVWDRLNNKNFDKGDPHFPGMTGLVSLFRDKGFDLKPQSIHSPRESDLILSMITPSYFLPAPQNAHKSYLWMLETPVSLNVLPSLAVRKRFHKIFTWSPEAIDNQQIYQVFIPYSFKGMDWYVFEKQKPILLAFVATYWNTTYDKFLNPHKATYAQRAAFVQWYLENEPDNFYLYGANWNKFVSSLNEKGKNAFKKHYKGSVADKIQAISQAKFVLAYENAIANGYISEKIFDAMKAGSVPVYFGAPDVKKYIPSNCFIDGSQFDSVESLHRYLKNMSEANYHTYQNHIKEFIRHFHRTPFEAENVYKRITKLIFETN